MFNAANPIVYWNQTEDDILLRIGVNDPQGTEIRFKDASMEFSAYTYDLVTNSPINFNFTLDLYEPTDREENMYELLDHQLQFILKKKSPKMWPQLSSLESEPSWIQINPEKPQKNQNEPKKNDQKNHGFRKLSEEYKNLNKNIHREEFETRNVHEDYPHMYDELHKAELGYRREELKKVYLVIYNLLQFVGFIYILTIMGIQYSRDGPDSMKDAYNNVGQVMKFIQLLQFLEVMHPMFGYTKGSAFITFLQVGGRAFILFCMIEAEPRMQPKPVVFYVFFVWSLVEVFRYPYYIAQLLNVEIPLLTWFRYTIWIPLYPLGFLCEGIIVLRNIPYFEETQKFTVSLPNSWNFAFSFPYFLRIYLLVLSIPGMYTMMSHMNKTRTIKLGRGKKNNAEKKKA